MTGAFDGLREAAAVFGLGDPLAAPVRVARGSMGEVFRLDTDQGSFAVKRLFPWNDGDSFTEELAFTARARASGVSVPRELLAAGETTVTAAGTRFRAYEWFDLAEPLPRPVS